LDHCSEEDHKGAHGGHDRPRSEKEREQRRSLSSAALATAPAKAAPNAQGTCSKRAEAFVEARIWRGWKRRYFEERALRVQEMIATRILTIGPSEG
jgi:hypothetical protein